VRRAAGTGDPSFAVLVREGARLSLSSDAGDGAFGQAVALPTDDVDGLFRKFRARGLATPGDPTAPGAALKGPLDQAWGTREFHVGDLDGHALRFVQDLRRPPASLDALTAAPDHHEVRLENDEVRVLETRIRPGEATPVHTHRWPNVLFVLAWSDFVRSDADGTACSTRAPSRWSPRPAAPSGRGRWGRIRPGTSAMASCA
jgi:hypothetical protein